MKKYILYAILLCLLGFGSFYFQEIRYGIGQARGQLNIIWNTRPLAEVLEDPVFPDSLKKKLLLIQEVRGFAIDSLGINDTENYTELYDQQGKPVLWAVNASPPFEIRAYEWCFPIAGCFPYKGYFEEEKAIREEQRLIAEGYDTYLRSVDGWSTLGFFKDPILSNMLREDEGELAELIIHELTHATLYIKDSVEYNENLATFVGNYGALEFLRYRYGDTSRVYQVYAAKNQDSRFFADYIVEQTGHLEVLYKTFTEEMPLQIKLALKKDAIRRICCSLDLTRFTNPERYRWMHSPDLYFPNNAWFSQYQTYHREANAFEEEFREKFDSDFKTYLTFLKEKYGSF